MSNEFSHEQTSKLRWWWHIPNTLMRIKIRKRCLISRITTFDIWLSVTKVDVDRIVIIYKRVAKSFWLHAWSFSPFPNLCWYITCLWIGKKADMKNEARVWLAAIAIDKGSHEMFQTTWFQPDRCFAFDSCMSFTLMKGRCYPKSSRILLAGIATHFWIIPRTMPLRLLLPRIDGLYKSVCLHCHFGELWQQQFLLAIQTSAAMLFTMGYMTKLMAVISWYMYTSLILRNTWLYFILDRYFYYLLFYAMFLPLDERWSVASRFKKGASLRGRIIVNPATVRQS